VDVKINERKEEKPEASGRSLVELVVVTRPVFTRTNINTRPMFANNNASFVNNKARPFLLITRTISANN